MDQQFEQVACNLCENENTQAISQNGQFGLTTNVVICRNCGLSYLNPRWTKETYLDFYINHYDNYYRPNINQSTAKTNAANPIFERITKEGLFTSNPKNILDIGSGAGENLNYLKTKFQDSNFYAIEPSDNAKIILEKNNIKVISKDVDSNWDSSSHNKFDLIIMRHVLEHFSDPVAALKRVENALSENGVLYIAVPNSLNPTTPLLSNWFRIVHTYYFNKMTLAGILQKSNLFPLTFVEGDHYNQGELYTFVKKNTASSSSTPKFNTTNYQQQLEVFQNRLKKEKQFIPTIRRKINFLNQGIRRMFK